MNYDIEIDFCLFFPNFMKINCWSWLMPSFTQNTDGIWMIWMLVQQPCGYMHSSSIKGPLKAFLWVYRRQISRMFPDPIPSYVKLTPFVFVCCMLKGNKRTFLNFDERVLLHGYSLKDYINVRCNCLIVIRLLMSSCNLL